MRGRIWIFAALVAAALVLHVVMLSAKVARTGEDNVRSRLALSSAGLRAQLELLDARLSPRAVATAPDLIEATRPPADPAEPLTRPNDRALRAAASAITPEPDLIAVVNGQGAIVSRRAKAAQGLDDAAPLPLAKAALEGNPAPAFALLDGVAFRVAAARVPGNGAAVLVGAQIDDHYAAQLKGQVDADVTLIQGGKVLASSLPSADERAQLVRWAAAPSPGYGVLEIFLPGIGNALSGKLPRLATRVAVRGTLVPLDSGVQAALTVPAGPFFGWLGRYQAFYALGLALFVLFSFVWGLLARQPAPAPVARVAEPLAAPKPQRRAPELVAADVGEPRTAPPPAQDVPWQSAEPEQRPVAERVESLDPEIPPPAPAAAAAAREKPAAASGGTAAQHPMWSADPFTPTPASIEDEAETVSADEVGLREAAPGPIRLPPPSMAEPVGQRARVVSDLDPEVEPEREAASEASLDGGPWNEPVPGGDARAGEPEPWLAQEPEPSIESESSVEREPAALSAAKPASSATRGDFNFAGMLDEAHGAQPAPEEESRPSLAQDFPDTTTPGGPSEALLAEARGEEPAAGPEPFPGDEPTRIEPVSAALLDKLRERDEELSAQAAARAQGDEAASAQQGVAAAEGGDAGDGAAENAPPAVEPAPDANVTMSDLSMPAVEPADPDERHWRETYDRFRELKAQLGEPADKIGFEKFATKLRKNRADLIARHSCKGVRFSVYEKDGKAAIKASAIR